MSNLNSQEFTKKPAKHISKTISAERLGKHSSPKSPTPGIKKGTSTCDSNCKLSKQLKEAITELYLAIKIRSTEELDQITENKLTEERQKLREASGFQVLEYIRSSIEIIMNLKIEDLEKEFENRNMFEGHSGDQSVTNLSVSSSNLIQQSMKDAIQAMNDVPDSARDVSVRSDNGRVKGPPKSYERIIQKLESDIRGHIRLEHEMKIHMDYLEGKIEQFQAQMHIWEVERQKLELKVGTTQDKLSLYKEQKDRENKELTRKLADAVAKLKIEREKISQLEKTLQQEREIAILQPNSFLPKTNSTAAKHPLSTSKPLAMSTEGLETKLSGLASNTSMGWSKGTMNSKNTNVYQTIAGTEVITSNSQKAASMKQLSRKASQNPPQSSLNKNNHSQLLQKASNLVALQQNLSVDASSLRQKSTSNKGSSKTHTQFNNPYTQDGKKGSQNSNKKSQSLESGAQARQRGAGVSQSLNLGQARSSQGFALDKSADAIRKQVALVGTDSAILKLQAQHHGGYPLQKGSSQFPVGHQHHVSQQLPSSSVLMEGMDEAIGKIMPADKQFVDQNNFQHYQQLQNQRAHQTIDHHPSHNQGMFIPNPASQTIQATGQQSSSKRRSNRNSAYPGTSDGQNSSSNQHTSIVVRNQINIINNASNQSTLDQARKQDSRQRSQPPAQSTLQPTNTANKSQTIYQLGANQSLAGMYSQNVLDSNYSSQPKQSSSKKSHSQAPRKSVQNSNQATSLTRSMQARATANGFQAVLTHSQTSIGAGASDSNQNSSKRHSNSQQPRPPSSTQMRNKQTKTLYTQNVQIKAGDKSHANATSQSLQFSKSQLEEVLAEQAFAMKGSNPAHTRTQVQINNTSGTTLHSTENQKFSQYGGNIQVLADNKEQKKRKKQLSAHMYQSLNNSKTGAPNQHQTLQAKPSSFNAHFMPGANQAHQQHQMSMNYLTTNNNVANQAQPASKFANGFSKK